MLTVTLGELRTRAFDRAYVPSTGGPVSTSEANTQINVQYRRLYRNIAVKLPRLFSKDQTITTESGTIAYARSPDWMVTTAVYVQENTNYLRPLRNVNAVDRSSLRAPGGVYTVIHRYVPIPATLSDDDDDAIDGICGLDEMVVLAVARYIRSKQQLETGDIAQELGEIERDVRRYDPDDGMPQFIEDVNGIGQSWPLAQSISGYSLRAQYLDLFQADMVWP